MTEQVKVPKQKRRRNVKEKAGEKKEEEKKEDVGLGSSKRVDSVADDLPLRVQSPAVGGSIRVKQEQQDEDAPIGEALVRRYPETETKQICQRERAEMAMALKAQRQPTLAQPSLANVYDQFFVAHFVEKNSGIRSLSTAASWVSLLPGLSTSVGGEARTQTLKLSIRAASMAFYAKLNADNPVLVDSFRWYSKCLHGQQRALSNIGQNAIPNHEECLTPIILSLYEVYAGTLSSESGVFLHLSAAARILALRGPQNCRSGFASSVFMALRASEAHRSVIFNTPSVFSAPDWITIPYTQTPKNAHMCLIDILFAIPHCIRLVSRATHLKSFFAQPLPSDTDLGSITARTIQLLHGLDDWAEKNPHLCTTIPTSRVTTEDMHTPLSTIASSQQQNKQMAILLPDTFIAFASGTFKATYMLLSLLLLKLSQDAQKHSATAPSFPAAPGRPSYVPHATANHILIPADSYSTPSPASSTSTSPSESQSTTPPPSTSSILPTRQLETHAAQLANEIIELSWHLDRSNATDFSFLRAVFPLVIVAVLAPRLEQRGRAKHILERWGRTKGLGGLCGSWGI